MGIDHHSKPTEKTDEKEDVKPKKVISKETPIEGK